MTNCCAIGMTGDFTTIKNKTIMEKITYEDLQSMVFYGDSTAFVYDDGTQVMYSYGEVNDDSLAPFLPGCLLVAMDDMPYLADLMRNNLLADLAPAHGVTDDGYMQLAERLTNGDARIAISLTSDCYMLILN